MNIVGAMRMEEASMPNKWIPFGAAIGAHFILFIWNPIILNSSSVLAPPPPPMQVTMEDKLPIAPPVPKVAPPKPVEKKKVVKKAHKAGITISHHQAPITVTHHRPVPPAPPAHHTFVSKVQMPKFVPHESDEPIAASPSPGISAPAPHPMVQAFTPAPKLRGKTRGVLISDVPMQLSDRGSISAGEHIVAIPIGEERGETASLPSAAVMHDAPRGIHTVSGYHLKPGEGSGSDDLAGKNRGYHGTIRADTYIEGTEDHVAEASRATSVATGHGFEIGGPVGDRKVEHRQLPEYPAWAEEKGISAMVKIYFTVKPDGSIRQSMRIIQSSGYEELDTLAKEALAKWHFSATSASSSASEAWGVITFRFTLG